MDGTALQQFVREKRDRFYGLELMMFYLHVSEFFLLVLKNFKRAALAFSDYLLIDPELTGPVSNYYLHYFLYNYLF